MPPISKSASASHDLRRRIDKSMSEGRFQNALEVSKQLFKGEPTQENRELLLKCYLGRATQLCKQGAMRDAATVLDVAAEYAENEPATLLRFAEELARCGAGPQALAILQRVPEPRPDNKVTALLADAAIQRGPAGRQILPPEMQAEFDRLRAAFAHAEADQGDAARELLAAIGLQSPFLEWKLLLRGLLAYYAQDDTRAIENWSRLDSSRFAARLAAPLRLLIDKPFAVAQSPSTQLGLQRQADRLQNNSVLIGLKRIQQHFLSSKGLSPAFREAELLFPKIKQQFPHLIPRLATCFYWEIVEQGVPADMNRFERLFGKSPDDPHLYRMSALALERDSNLVFAHKAWEQFIQDMSASPARWPKAIGDRAQAMVCYRMGMNAQRQDDVAKARKQLNGFDLGDDPGERPQPLRPSAADCFRKAADLAPDWLDPQWELFECHRLGGKTDQAIKIGEQLLARFPDHVPTMQALAAIYKSTGEFAAAVKRLKHAIEVNPLDQALRTELGNVHRLHGAALTVEGNLVEARAAFRSAVELLIGRQRFLALCHWAACEFKAGADAASEQLLARISADEANRPAMAACLFALAVALIFPKPAKARFEREFRQQLAAKPTIPTVSALVGLYAQFELDDFTYHGGKTHQKRVLTLAERLIDEPFTEAEMDSLGGALLALRARRSLKRLAQWWRVIFRADPYPLFFELECDLISDDCRWPIWRLKPFAERALRLAEKMPQGERRDYVLKRIKARLQQFHDLDPFSSMFESIFDSGSSGDSDWEDNDSW